MDVTALTSYAHKRSRTNDTVWADDDVLEELNIALSKVTHRIMQKITSFDFNGEIATADTKDYHTVVEGEQGFDGKYRFPTDLLKIVRVEIKQNSIYQKIEEQDVTVDVRELTDTYGNFYSVFRGIIRISPKPVVSVPGGLKIWYEKRQEKLIAIDDVPTLEENFHPILALEACRSFLISDPTDQNVYRKDAIEQQLMELYVQLDKFYATKENRNYKLTPKYSNYGS
jgi:hypothetical protein